MYAALPVSFEYKSRVSSQLMRGNPNTIYSIDSSTKQDLTQDPKMVGVLFEVEASNQEFHESEQRESSRLK